MIVEAIVDYVIETGQKPNGQPWTQLDIQKILYYAQGWHLAFHGEPLFDEEVRAWRNGPVVRSAYGRLRRYQDRPIGREAMRTNPRAVLAGRVRAFLDKIISIYGNYSPGDLVGFTHMRGSAWRIVRDENGYKLGDDSDILIPDDLLASSLLSQNRSDLEDGGVIFDIDGSIAIEFENMLTQAM